MRSKIRSTLEIKDGRVVNPNYPYDYHVFFDDKIIHLKVILPGIVNESVLVKIDGLRITIKASICKEYRSIFRCEEIELSGNLPEKVLTGVLTSSYEHGILSIDLVSSSHKDGGSQNRDC